MRVELNEARVWKTVEKGAYTPEVRSLVREYVDAGCAQSRVGGLLLATGKAFGAAVSHSISRKTVARAVREAGIASDIQLGMEMTLAPGTFSFPCLLSTIPLYLTDYMRVISYSFES